MYKELGDWESIYDWDGKRGIPREATEYKDVHIKGWILERLRGFSGGRILDVGCGNGYFLLQIRRQLLPAGASIELFGVDPSRHNIANFHRKIERDAAQDIYPMLGTAESLPLNDNSIDVVVSSEVFEHIADKRAALVEVHRVLKRGGILLFTTPSESALVNWDRVTLPIIVIRRLIQLRLKRRESVDAAFDQPVSKSDYRIMLGSAGFAEIELESGQMLNDEVTTRLPKALLGSYVAATRALENRSRKLRDLFGLHIHGYARKAA
jgi:ubiquinone/menaquinone biosynthesis C-methylase UbiE